MTFPSPFYLKEPRTDITTKHFKRPSQIALFDIQSGQLSGDSCFWESYKRRDDKEYLRPGHFSTEQGRSFNIEGLRPEMQDLSELYELNNRVCDWKKSKISSRDGFERFHLRGMNFIENMFFFCQM